MECNRIKYETPEMELLEIRVDVITKSLEPDGSSKDDVVVWPT